MCHVQTECLAIMHGRCLTEISFETISLNSTCSSSCIQLLPSCYSGFAFGGFYHLQIWNMSRSWCDTGGVLSNPCLPTYRCFHKCPLLLNNLRYIHPHNKVGVLNILGDLHLWIALDPWFLSPVGEFLEENRSMLLQQGFSIWSCVWFLSAP